MSTERRNEVEYEVINPYDFFIDPSKKRSSLWDRVWLWWKRLTWSYDPLTEYFIGRPVVFRVTQQSKPSVSKRKKQ